MMDERRHNRRQRVIKGGKVFFHNQGSTLDCVVRNMTEEGAHLKLESTNSVPDRFDLLINQENLLYPAEVAWRNMTDIGIRFTGAPKGMTSRKLPR